MWRRAHRKALPLAPGELTLPRARTIAGAHAQPTDPHHSPSPGRSSVEGALSQIFFFRWFKGERGRLSMSDVVRDDEVNPEPPVPRGNPDMPDLRNWGGLRSTKKALRRSATIMHNREAIAYELLAMASTKITDVMSWDEEGNVTLIPSKRIDHRHARMIKSVKKTTRTLKDGGVETSIEVSLFDKVSTLRLLAQAAGLLAKDTEDDKPSVVGMKVLGPKKRKPRTLENGK